MNTTSVKDLMLHEEYEVIKAKSREREYFFKGLLKQHSDIVNSLNPKFKIRDYQREAIGRFIYYFAEDQDTQMPYHLLFNMATGSGKTLIMAATMLFLHKQGYRNFIFFTHLSNIIEKTKDNFLNPNSSKYLFSKEISLGGQKVAINEVDSFDAGSGQDINMVFTTMAGLHSKWQNPRENGLSADAIADKKIVLLGDEAHHFSAKTKKLGSMEEKENKHWEHTILDKDDLVGNLRPGLLHVNSSSENILLEFTATLDWEDPQIKEKYNNKIIYKYDLLEFRKNGYSKNVSTLQFDAPYFDRCLAAMVLSQYRLKVSQKFKLNPKSIKPIILFKANRISDPKDESKTRGDNPAMVVSNRFKDMFHKRITSLHASDLEQIKNGGESIGMLKKAFEFFKSESITMEHLAKEIKSDFAPEYCLSVDQKEDLDDKNKQLILNSLEDEDNNIRAIFATEKLNEGWDVLNLFDIVRLYDSRDAKDDKPGKTTIQEAQLIGRGARYCPFEVDEHYEMYKRKFDDRPDNHLAALEILHYHCTHNPKYIREIDKALIEQGSKDKDWQEYTIEPKKNIPEFKIKTSWKKIEVFLNKRIKRPKEETEKAVKDAIENWDDRSLKLSSMGMREDSVGIGNNNIVEYSRETSVKTKRIRIQASDLGENVFRHAIGAFPKAHFDKLMKYFSDIKSISEFIQIIMNGVGKFTIEIAEGTHLSQNQKLKLAKEIVGDLLDNMFKHKTDYVGSTKYNGKPLEKIFGKPKVRRIVKEESTSYKAADIQALVDQPWFAQTNFMDATDQEIAFLEFVNDRYEDIKKLYDYFLVFRNDNHFSIYNTENEKHEEEGEAFNPDFLLVLREKGTGRFLTHQVFVEAKGPQFLRKEEGKKTFTDGNQGWKQDFLLRILNESEISAADKELILLGLPFFHKNIDDKCSPQMQEQFKNAFENSVLSNVPDD